MTDCSVDHDCPGCMCPSGHPPCTHCVQHWTEDESAATPTCRCRALTGYHDWNCELTPIWAQTMRDHGINPFTHLWMPLSERDFQTMWRRAGRDPIPHTRMIEGREHTSWYMPGSGLIFETVVPRMTGPFSRTLALFGLSDEPSPYTLAAIPPRWCHRHGTYHFGGCS